jgi:hypothetical protein
MMPGKDFFLALLFLSLLTFINCINKWVSLWHSLLTSVGKRMHMCGKQESLPAESTNELSITLPNQRQALASSISALHWSLHFVPSTIYWPFSY